MTNFLHKMSSYLQIVLENEHKHKWNKKRSSELYKPTETPKIPNHPTFHIKRSKTKVILNQNLSNTKCIQAIREQTDLIKKKKANKEPKYLFKQTFT